MQSSYDQLGSILYTIHFESWIPTLQWNVSSGQVHYSSSFAWICMVHELGVLKLNHMAKRKRLGSSDDEFQRIL
jgi:hypothetical protein